MEPLILTSSFLFGKELMTQTVTNSTKTILGSVTTILDDEDFTFKKMLMEYDLTSKVEIINIYINEITNNNSLFEKHSVKLAIKNVLDMLEHISIEIKVIEKKIKQHKELWFHIFRTPDYKILLLDLESNIKILNERFKLLIEIKN